MTVVTEGATGVRATYWFQLNNNQHVWIGRANGEEDIVYIPGRCVNARMQAVDHMMIIHQVVNF